MPDSKESICTRNGNSSVPQPPKALQVPQAKDGQLAQQSGRVADDSTHSSSASLPSPSQQPGDRHIETSCELQNGSSIRPSLSPHDVQQPDSETSKDHGEQAMPRDGPSVSLESSVATITPHKTTVDHGVSSCEPQSSYPTVDSSPDSRCRENAGARITASAVNSANGGESGRNLQQSSHRQPNEAVTAMRRRRDPSLMTKIACTNCRKGKMKVMVQCDCFILACPLANPFSSATDRSPAVVAPPKAG